MKRIAIILLIIIVVAILLVIYEQKASPGEQVAVSAPVDVTVLHINDDTHAHLEDIARRATLMKNPAMRWERTRFSCSMPAMYSWARPISI